MQNSCIGTYMTMVFCLPPHHLYLAFLPMLSLPNLPTLCYSSPSPNPTTGPSVWYSPPCVHVFSLFNTYLWVRTCSVWFSVLVSVCWEWWFPASSMSLQRTWTHPFYGCIVFHGIYVPHFLYPVYHCWAFGLVPGHDLILKARPVFAHQFGNYWTQCVFPAPRV